jgi:hypothetical protein
MKWIEPDFSKEKVNAAGKSLISADINSEDSKSAAVIFHKWGSQLAPPSTKYRSVPLDLIK